MINDGFMTKREVLKDCTVCKCGARLTANNLRIKWGSYLGQGGMVLQKYFFHKSCKHNVWVDEHLT